MCEEMEEQWKQLSGIEEGKIGVYYAVIRHSGLILETTKLFKRENNMFACIRENRFLVWGFCCCCLGQGGEKREIRKLTCLASKSVRRL